MAVELPFLVRLGGALVFLLLVHLSVVLHRPVLGAIVVVAFLALNVTRYVRGKPALHKTVLLSLAAGLILILSLPLGGREGSGLIYAPPLLINAFLAYQFGRSLAAGREPLITRICRLERGRVPPELARYTRRLTLAWAYFMTAITVEVAILSLVTDITTWSWYANVVNPLAALAFFAVEHPYRYWRYSEFGPYSLAATFKVMLRRDAWLAE